MAAQVRLTVRGMDRSEALENQVRERCTRLEHFHPRIESVDVAIELEQHHKHHGNPFKVRIVIGVPGNDVVVNHHHDEDAYIALRDAFDAATRQLKAAASRARGDDRGRHRVPAPAGPDDEAS